MTNREFMIAVLSDENLDPFDNGADGEAMVHYNIACPYIGINLKAKCYPHDVSPNRELCVACKMEWLEMEVDE